MTATETKPSVQNTCCASAAPERPEAAKKVFLPRADIYETKDAVELVADMPGVDEKSVEITLEKNILTLRGTVESSAPAGHKVAYAEYDEGNYERAFKVSDEIDREGIQASVKNGVVRVTLRKAGPAKVSKIEVKAS